MIRLSNFQPTQINAPEVRPGAMAAPALALGHVAQAIGNIGEQFHGIAVNAQKQENARVVSEKLMGLDSAYSALQIDLEKDPDPASVIKRTQEFFSGYKANFEGEDLPPAVQRELAHHYDRSAHSGIMQQTAAAARLQQKRTGLQLNNEVEAMLTSGNQAGAHAAIDRGVAAGVMLPEEAIAGKRKVDEALTLRETQRQITTDPAGWLAANPPDKIPAGYDPLQWQNQQSFARGQLRTRTYDATSKILDAMATGAITKPEQIDGLSGDLRPAAVEELKQALAQRGEAGYRDKIATPEFQAETYGKISGAIANYNPDDENADVHLAQIDTAMRNLKPGYLRDKLEKQFKELGANGQLAETKSYGDFVLKQVDELAKVGRFGKVPEIDKIKTADLVKDGFLKDPAKLQRLGFSADQAETIAEAAAKDPALGQGKLSELWTKRDAGNVKADEFEIATANALRLGQATVNYDDPDSAAAVAPVQLETARKYGIAKMKLEEFLRITPEAKQPEIDAEFLKVTGEGIRAEAKAKFIPPKPTRGGETSMNVPKGGLKLSNYGYASDTTPDSNSAKGIGHRNNKLIAGESAAISKSLADRLGLSHGDKLKIETTKGDFTVFYHDTVPATDSRTGDLPETIDIYRPKDGANSWSGRVTKVSKV